MTSFDTSGLDPRILRVVSEIGFVTPTPIQVAAVPALLSGRDVVGGARTGSGKTAAFGLPMLHRLAAEQTESKGPRALVLVPTRELALQVETDLKTYGRELRTRTLAVYGGAPYTPQLKELRKGVDVVVGTPGRLLDHMDRGALDLKGVQMLVLDEADEMLRMGFIDDVERLLGAIATHPQTALFSATMPTPIRRLAERFLREPIDISVEESAHTVGHIEQAYIAVKLADKVETLVRLIRSEEREGILVFTNTRRDCAEVSDALNRRGLVAEALHGDLDQQARERVLSRLRDRTVQVVVATDVAARGLDVEHLSHVINFELPNDVDSYVHRIGRTARAGRGGKAISLVTPRERSRLGTLHRRLGSAMRQIQAPTERAVRIREALDLENDLRRLLPDGEAARAWLEERIAAGWDPKDLATAAIHALATARSVDLRPVPAEAPAPIRMPAPVQMQGRDHRDSEPRRSSGYANGHGSNGHASNGHGGQDRQGSRPPMQRPRTLGSSSGPTLDLFLPIGKQSGVRPSDLVGALTNEARVPFDAIGRISVHPRVSYVVVDEDHAIRVAKEFPELAIRGKPSAVLLSNTSRP